MEKIINIGNMVCNRCIKVIQDELDTAGIEVVTIEMGKVKVRIQEQEQLKTIENLLVKNDFLLLLSEEEKVVENVKLELIKLLKKLPLSVEILSSYLSNQLGADYSKISRMFSYNQGITIEKYFIKLKIEKVKELIQHPEKNFTEISQLLDYSHSNHLSRQFKAETGMSLSKYKAQQEKFRLSLDKIV